jgi:hypothetical protein
VLISVTFVLILINFVLISVRDASISVVSILLLPLPLPPVPTWLKRVLISNIEASILLIEVSNTFTFVLISNIEASILLIDVLILLIVYKLVLISTIAVTNTSSVSSKSAFKT